MTSDQIEIKKEGEITKVIDAFPRQTAPEATPPVTPATVEKTLENGEGITPQTPPNETTPAPQNAEVPPATPPAKPAQPTAPEKPQVDWKEKFVGSARRNQIVESQFKELQKILGDITKQEVPTDDEMVALIPDWEYLSDREKNAERKLVVIERRQNHIINTFGNINTETENVSKFEHFLANEPRLKGKEDEFYEFTTRPINKGVPMETLLNAFLFEATPIVDTTPVTPPSEEIPPSLERGTPSGNMPPVKTGNQEMSADELRLLRTTDPRKYNEMVRKGQI